MGYLIDLISEVEQTHKNYGNLIAMLQVAVKAKKMMLIVSPSGCGKSKAMETVAEQTPDAYMPDRLSIAGLANNPDRFNNFQSGIFVDDITTTGTPYARNQTITVLAALCYSHKIESAMHGIEYKIENFNGAAVIGIQPIMLRNIMLSDEWDGSIQDKALRYYHLYRPVKPKLARPDVKLQNGIDFDRVNNFEPDYKSDIWRRLLRLGYSQWSVARTEEHLKDFLKAIVAIENRRDIIEDDYVLLERLLKPMAIENIVVVKEQLEGERYLDNNCLALLAEYYSYNGEFPLAQIAMDFKCTLPQTYKIMASQNGNWQQTQKKPTLYRPSKRLLDSLKEYGLEVKENANKHSK